jgi:hypothetical protein
MRSFAMDSDKIQARRHRRHDEQTLEARGDMLLGPSAEERQAKRVQNSRRLRKLRKKAARSPE